MKPPMVVMLGPPKVGKTSLLQRFTERRFPRAYIPTVEDLYTQVLKCPDGLYRAIEIIDTSGGDDFPVMRELRIKQADMFIVVYSVDSLPSLRAAIKLCKNVHTIKGEEDVALLLVGNKIDLANRAVPSELALELTKEFRCSHIESSAKLDVNIHSMIESVLSIKHFPPKDKKKDPVEGNAVGSCRLFRCFSVEKKPKKFPIQRSHTFSGVSQDTMDRMTFKIRSKESATVP